MADRLPSTKSVASRRDVSPLLAGYWAFGQYWGMWVIVVYEFLRQHGLSASQIGLYYAALSVVSVLVMLVVAPRMQPLPAATTVPLSLCALGVGALVQAYAPTGALLLLGFGFVGMGNGLIDVFMNVAAQRIEVQTRRPILQWMHACYALGGVTGALAAGLLLTAGGDHRIGIAATGLVLFAIAGWNARTASREPNTDAAKTRVSISVFRRAPMLLVPALIVLSAFLVEGSMDTWSGLYLRGQLMASAFGAALAFAAFAGAVFVGRLFAGRVLFGLGYRRTVIFAGSGACAGGLVAALTDSPVVAGLAFLVMGFSLASAAPAAFGLVEGSGEDPTNSIAAITTVGYSGFIWSPPLVGWVADAFSLRATMVVQLAATLGVLAGGLLAKDPEPD